MRDEPLQREPLLGQLPLLLLVGPGAALQLGLALHPQPLRTRALHREVVLVQDNDILSQLDGPLLGWNTK